MEKYLFKIYGQKNTVIIIEASNKMASILTLQREYTELFLEDWEILKVKDFIISDI